MQDETLTLHTYAEVLVNTTESKHFFTLKRNDISLHTGVFGVRVIGVVVETVCAKEVVKHLVDTLESGLVNTEVP